MPPVTSRNGATRMWNMLHETLASVSAPNKYKQINDKILLETLTRSNNTVQTIH